MLKVLVVDDEVLERKALTKIIQSSKLDVTVIGEASNGRIAIEMASEQPPDIIFMDIKMPGVDGVEAVKVIKQFAPDIRFIMVSAFNTFEYAKEVMQQGVKEYVLKPSYSEEILASLKRVIDEINIERRREEENQSLRENLSRAVSIAQKEWESSLLVKQEVVEAQVNKHAKSMLQKAKEYLEDHYADSITLEGVAEYMELSPFYFSKFFKDRTGMTFIDYLTEIRINYAKKEMEDPSKSLKEICYSVGYRDPNYFSRVFKKQTGLSPTEYRNEIIG